jgi:mono/diheme cytochrome c family protein
MLTVLMIASCANDWRTDMWYQASHRPEATPRPLPEHSVPLGAGAPPPLDIDDTDALRSPVPADAQSLARGKELFVARCAPCHGAEGHGKGPVSRFFPPAPDLAYPAIQARTDGHLYGTILLGGKAMPPQSEGLSEPDRWALVNYVRVLQRDATPTGGPQ